jgi:acid phosphatase
MRKWVLAVVALGLFALGGVAGFRGNAFLESKGCERTFADLVPVALQTAAPDTVRFVAVGDTGTGDAAEAKVAEAVRKVCGAKGCDFVLLLGDNFYPDGVASVRDPQFRTAYEAMYGPLGKPVLAVVGNHDVRNHPIYQVAYSLVSPTWRMPNYSYSFTAGPARFFAVNTNCGLLQWHALADRLDPALAGWTFVFGHHSLYSDGPHGDTDFLTRWYWGHYLAPAVDFYLAGHNHVLEHLELPGRRTEYIVSGAGAKYGGEEPAGGAEGPSGKRAQGHVSRAERLFHSDEGGFAWFQVAPREASVGFYDGDGALLYEYTTRRPASGPAAASGGKTPP